MGCCGAVSNNEFIIDIDKREKFINNFFNKDFKSSNEPEERSGVFIKTQTKKMKISKKSIYIEVEINLTVKSEDPNDYSNSFWFLMDCEVNKLKSKEIYIDDIKVDDSTFEIDEYNIKIKYEKLFNGQIRKVKVIQEIDKKLTNYSYHKLILNKKDVLVKFLIYGEDIKIDDITNKNYILDKKLNLAYFEGKTTSETVLTHGYINYSRIINYQIYKYIPEFIKKEEEIIKSKKDNNEQNSINVLAIYKKINITDYGQEVDEIYKILLLNYNGGTISTTISHGLMKDTKFDVELVELNGMEIKTDYTKENSSIKINNFGASNNQFAEIHMKYKYYTNKDKSILRQESIITTGVKNTYCNIILNFPDDYVVLSSKEIFLKNPKYNNLYFYNGISNEEELHELFKFCFKKASWDIQQEFTLEANNNIEQCTFLMNRLYKGGNLKETEFEVIREGEFIDNEKEDQYIFNYKDLKTNKTTIEFKLKVENSTSGYKFIEKKELITKIPEEDKKFFKDLSDKIIKEDKSNFPIYKKLGRWVYNYLKYDLSYYGEDFTAREIYNNKSGICKHYTLLYNTLLVSQGIDAINITGYALDITENNIMKENETNKKIPNEPNTLTSSRHDWTLAKIKGEWIPLDATWNMFDKNLPITHIFQNYGNVFLRTRSNSDNLVDNKITKEVIKYIKNKK